MFHSTRQSRRHRTPPPTEDKQQQPFFIKAGSEHGHATAARPFFQAKPNAGQSGDPYEKEADAVADTVVLHAHQLGNRNTILPRQISAVHNGNGASPIQRQPTNPAGSNPPGNQPAATDVSSNFNIIPPDWVKEPGQNDSLVFVHNQKLLALPARGGYYVTITQMPAGISPSEPVFSVPTVGKEGLSVVRVGARTGFQVDAGGQPAVVFPLGMNAIREALGVESIKGVVISHMHEDHVRSFVELVRTQNISPANIYFPEAFAVNPGAKSSMFAKAIVAMQADPALQRLGHGAGANYQILPTAQQGNFIHNHFKEGNVRFDTYGISREFQRLHQARATGGSQSMADAASLVTRATYTPTGYSVLFLSDLRGSNLTMLRTAMGEAAYNQMLQGVQVVHGFQHHMGALSSQADKDGLIEFLIQTQMRTGSLTVVNQSTPKNLNRSTIKALTDMGVDVYTALEPAGGQVGTITGSTGGQMTQRGFGNMESATGSVNMQMTIMRLNQLRQAEEVLTTYKHLIKDGESHAQNARVARTTLEANLVSYMRASMGGVQQGSAKSQMSLTSSAQQQQGLLQQRINQTHPFEWSLISPPNQDFLKEMARVGPHVNTWQKELAAARQTGRISPAGIDALWELNPKMAERLVKSSGLSSRQMSSVFRQLPHQALPMRTRAGAGFMLALELFNMAAPIIEQSNAKAFNKNIATSLEDILWWQDKGVFPEIQGVVDWTWPYDNEWTSSPARIQELLNDRDLDYLAIIDIPEEFWDYFMVWATANINNYREWHSHITQSKAIKSEGTHMGDLVWYYRIGVITGETFGHDLDFIWKPNPRLTTILRAVGKHMIEGTEKDINKVFEHGVEPDTTKHAWAQNSIMPIFYRKAKPVSAKRKVFKQDVDEPALYTLVRQRERTGFPKDDSTFLIFPNSAVDDSEIEVPDEYYVVGGADYNTYMRIYNTENRVYEWGRNGNTYESNIYPNSKEVLLAKKTDLVDATTA